MSPRYGDRCGLSRAVTLLAVLCCAGNTAATRIPPSLRTHIAHKLAAAARTSAAAVDSLVDEIVSHAPPEQSASWCQVHGDKLARLIAARASVGEDLLTGRTTIPEAISAAEIRARESVEMFDAVQVRHMHMHMHMHKRVRMYA